MRAIRLILGGCRIEVECLLVFVFKIVDKTVGFHTLIRLSAHPSAVATPL